MELILRAGLKECKTDKQVLALLKKLGLKIVIDERQMWLEETGKKYFDVRLDQLTRIHGTSKKGYKLQLWNRTTEKTVGKKLVPQCHGYMMEIDDVITIRHEYDGILKGMK